MSRSTWAARSAPRTVSRRGRSSVVTVGACSPGATARPNSATPTMSPGGGVIWEPPAFAAWCICVAITTGWCTATAGTSRSATTGGRGSPHHRGSPCGVNATASNEPAPHHPTCASPPDPPTAPHGNTPRSGPDDQAQTAIPGEAPPRAGASPRSLPQTASSAKRRTCSPLSEQTECRLTFIAGVPSLAVQQSNHGDR